MAYSFAKKTPSGATVYNTDYQVGLTGANFKPDVMLVQALLNLLYFTNDGEFYTLDYACHTFEAPLDAEPLKVDGLCGPLTRSLIVSYQQRLQRITAKYPADGRLDPVMWSGGKTLATRGGGLLNLGNSLHLSDEVHGTQRYASVAWDPELPQELRSALAYRKNTARLYATPGKKFTFTP